MKKIKVFQLNIAQLVIRFYLMMAVVIGLGMLHQFKLAAIFGFAVAISAILGAGFEKRHRDAEIGVKSGRIVPVQQNEIVRKAG